MNGIKEYINKKSEYVSVNKSKIIKFINEIQNWDYIYWCEDLKKILNEKERILFSFLYESINFCFWDANKYYERLETKGSSDLFFNNFKKNIISNRKLLKINYLMSMDFNDFKKLININSNDFPMLNKRFKLLKETIKVINDKGKDFFEEIFCLKSDIELLDYIIINFHHFKDESLYKNKIIKFNKRATLLVNDLYQLSETVKKNIKNLNNMTGCADYALPRFLYEKGILKYNNKLTNIIKSKSLIKHNSNMEIEIRANTLYVIEKIKKHLNDNDIKLNSIEIDNLIWKMRTNNKHFMPVHRTITIFY